MQLYQFLLAAVTITGSLAAPALVQARQSSGWTVHSLNKECNNVRCVYRFSIDINDGSSPAICYITDYPSDTERGSWYDQTCSPEDSAFHVSWGLDNNTTPPFAVMTVVDQSAKLEAFFGYANVTGGSQVWPDNGPQPTQPA